MLSVLAPVLSVWTKVSTRHSHAGSSAPCWPFMYTKQPFPSTLRRLAERQHGVLTAQQLSTLSRSALRRFSSDWVKLAKGLYCLSEPTWLSAVCAGVTRAGLTSSVGSVAAAHLHGLHDEEPEEIRVWLPETVSKPALTVGPWRIQFKRGARSGVGWPPRTGIEETLLDSAWELGEDSTVALITRALAQRTTTAPRIMTAAEERIRLRHRTTIRALCDATTGGIESVLEWRYLERVERQHALPPLERQAQVGRYRLDGLYREFGIIVELDGRAFHDAARDMERDNFNAVHHGLTTLRYGWHAVTSTPCDVARQVADMLSHRGWAGSLRRCVECPAS